MRVTVPTEASPAAGGSRGGDGRSGGGGGSDGDGDQCAVVAPPKKGGECSALDGALLVVQPSSAYHPKKDALTFARVAATERHQYVPSPRRADETLWSEVYSLGGRGRALKAGVRVALPVRSLRHPDVQDAHLRVRCAGDETWQYADYVKSERNGRPYIEFDLAKAASFAMTVSPRTETFVVTDQGLLYNAKISHYVSVRFPKKSIDANQMEFSIQIRPMDQLKMALMKDEQSDEVGDFVAASDFYDIAGPQMTFRRALTVKIGLPTEGFEEENAECIALLRRALPSAGECTPAGGGGSSGSGAWCLVEEQLKFTKTTVTFNTTQLGRFVVARAKPKRTPRLQGMLGTVERRNARVRCAVVASLRRDPKAWTLWMDAARVDEVPAAVARRESRGAVCVDSGDVRALRGRIESDEPAADGASRFAGRYYRGARKRTPAKKEVTYLAFADSAVAVRFEVCGDLQIVGEAEPEAADTEAARGGPRLHELLFCDALRENARSFAVQPRKSDYMAAPVGIINVYAAESEGGELLRSITIALDARSVDEYHREEPVPVEPALTEPMDTDAAARPPTPEETPAAATRLPPIRFKPISAHLSRLAASNRVAARPVKEPRVLSGKSLQALANYVTEGLSLAVHLGISESVITGIGFDALSNGLGLPEVTYRMLLRWKRMGRATAPERVGQLSEALKAIGRVDIAALVWECHARCQELTAETLRAGHALPDDTADDDMGIRENAE